MKVPGRRDPGAFVLPSGTGRRRSRPARGAALYRRKPRRGVLMLRLSNRSNAAQGFPADTEYPAVDFAQVGGELADRPAGEGLAEFGRTCGGRLDDETSSSGLSRRGRPRPARVQTGQADLVEPVNDIAHRVFVGRHQLGDGRHPVPASRGQQHHRPPIAHRVGTAPPHYLLQPLTLLISQPTHFDRRCHQTSARWMGRQPYQTGPSSSAGRNPVNLRGHSTSQQASRNPPAGRRLSRTAVSSHHFLART